MEIAVGIWRMRSILEVTGLSRTTVWRRVRDGSFPAPVKLGEPPSRAVGWRIVDVEEWLRARKSANSVTPDVERGTRHAPA